MTPNTIIGEFFYVLIGVVFLISGAYCIRDRKLKNRIPSAAFWWILAAAFMFGPHVPSWMVGVCVIVIACITAIFGVGMPSINTPSTTSTRDWANKLGFKVFLPPITLAVMALVAATVLTKYNLSSHHAIGISSAVALAVAFLVTRAPAKYAPVDGARLNMNVGPVGILPQLLASLGAVFTAAGVGAVISKGVAAVIPGNNALAGVIAYCVGMALFTIIMGNGFAAFAVITVGIGIPFVVQAGGNPIIVSTLGLTAGYCGTLLTPMAANFNIVPVALLETKDKYAVIKAQAPMALVLLLVHIVLMYTLAF